MELLDKNKTTKHIPNTALFAICTISSSVATLIFQPLDLIKNRMQMSGEGGALKEHVTSMHAIHSVVRKEGVRGLYSGLSANILRQITLTPTRMVVFQVTLDQRSVKEQTEILYQVQAGLVGGFFGGFIGFPADVAFTRMATDGKLPPEKRRNYTSLLNALTHIAHEEKTTKCIWRIVEPKVLFSMVVNASQLVSYIQARSFLVENGYMENNISCHFASSLFCSFAQAVAACPFDVAKTRYQQMRTGLGPPMYTSMFDVFVKIYYREGLFALWKGLGPLYLRVAPHTTVLFLLVEKLTFAYRDRFMDSSPENG